MSNPTDSRPALLGGTPIFPHGPPTWPPVIPELDAILQDALASGSWGQYHGPNGPVLEAELAEHFGVNHAPTCASGTLAVEIALRAVGVGANDEVILSA